MNIPARTMHPVIAPTVHSVITLLRAKRDTTIKQRFILVSEIKTVLHVFVVIGIEDEVAVFGMVYVISIGRQFGDAFSDGDSSYRNFMQMFVELFKKRAGKIVIARIIFGIPFV